jgi:hypothetical protein
LAPCPRRARRGAAVAAPAAHVGVPAGPPVAAAVASPPQPSRLLESACKRRRRTKGPETKSVLPAPNDNDPQGAPGTAHVATAVLQEKPVYAHSMIRTLRMHVTPAIFQELQETVCIPPAQVEATTTPVLGLAMLQGICEYALGMPFRRWVETVAVGVVSAIYFKCTADSATANILLQAIWQVAVQLIGLRHGIVTYFWFEPCQLHQLARITLCTLTASALIAPFYAISKALTRWRNVRRFEAALRKVVSDLVEWHDMEGPPVRYPRWKHDGWWCVASVKLATL